MFVKFYLMSVLISEFLINCVVNLFLNWFSFLFFWDLICKLSSVFLFGLSRFNKSVGVKSWNDSNRHIIGDQWLFFKKVLKSLFKILGRLLLELSFTDRLIKCPTFRTSVKRIFERIAGILRSYTNSLTKVKQSDIPNSACRLFIFRITFPLIFNTFNYQLIYINRISPLLSLLNWSYSTNSLGNVNLTLPDKHIDPIIHFYSFINWAKGLTFIESFLRSSSQILYLILQNLIEIKFTNFFCTRKFVKSFCLFFPSQSNLTCVFSLMKHLPSTWRFGVGKIFLAYRARSDANLSFWRRRDRRRS